MSGHPLNLLCFFLYPNVGVKNGMRKDLRKKGLARKWGFAGPALRDSIDL